MRNAVIRKKRLKAERIVDDYMRMPQRIIVPTFNVTGKNELSPDQFKVIAERLWVI